MYSSLGRNPNWQAAEPAPKASRVTSAQSLRVWSFGAPGRFSFCSVVACICMHIVRSALLDLSEWQCDSARSS